jgi:hypothetical protein
MKPLQHSLQSMAGSPEPNRAVGSTALPSARPTARPLQGPSLAHSWLTATPAWFGGPTAGTGSL